MSFQGLSIGLNASIFLVAALAVWMAGTKLAHYADAIAERTGIGREVLGILLLGGVTSLPELAVATTATLQGTPILSINNLLGTASITLVILAAADGVSGRRALSSMQDSPLVILQGVIGILLLALAAAAVVVGDVLVLGMGAWSWAMLPTYLAGVWLIAHSKARRGWRAVPLADPALTTSANNAEQGGLRSLISKSFAVGAVILVAGFLLAHSGDALAEQSGLGQSFFGAIFLAFATSLPEWSTAIAATRLHRYEMAISDIFGTNLFNVTIIVLVDALHAGGAVMQEGGSFAAFSALLALVLTAIYIAGLIERRHRTFLRMGWDSWAVLGVYGCGVVVLHGLR